MKLPCFSSDFVYKLLEALLLLWKSRSYVGGEVRGGFLQQQRLELQQPLRYPPGQQHPALLSTALGKQQVKHQGFCSPWWRCPPSALLCLAPELSPKAGTPKTCSGRSAARCRTAGSLEANSHGKQGKELRASTRLKSIEYLIDSSFSAFPS